MSYGSVLKNNEQVRANLSTTSEKLNNSRGIEAKPGRDSEDDFLEKVKKAIEANNLCYNCETGFHYMKQ